MERWPLGRRAPGDPTARARQLRWPRLTMLMLGVRLSSARGVARVRLPADPRGVAGNLSDFGGRGELRTHYLRLRSEAAVVSKLSLPVARIWNHCDWRLATVVAVRSRKQLLGDRLVYP